MQAKLFVALILSAAATAYAASPLEAFAAPEEMKDAVISPDGRYLAVISMVDGLRVVLVRDIQNNGKFAPVMSGDEKGDFDITWCRFANSTRLLCGLNGAAMLRTFIVPSSKIAAVDAAGTNLAQVMSSQDGRATAANDRIFDRVAEDTNKVIVRTGGGREGEETIYLYSVDLTTNKVSQLKDVVQERKLWNGYIDGRGRLRLADGYGTRSTKPFDDPFGNLRIADRRTAAEQSLYVSSDGKQWTKLEKASEFAKTNPLSRLAVNAATGRAYGYATHNGRSALFEFDLEDKNLPQVGFAHPKVDAGDVVTDGMGRLIGVSYATDRQVVQYVDAALASALKGINQSLPNKFNSIRSMSDDKKVLIIASRSDVEAGRFYMYEADTRKLSPIGAMFSKLDPAQLASMRPIEYAARDGKTVPGYLTTPPGGEAKKLPLVVLLHDGQSRAHWTYDELTQFLATRGYAVLTVNHRGSTGYSKEWREAGKDKWGDVIYTDVTDGAQWAVAQGIADPRKVCVIGRGYSGYTALLGAIRNADVYKCVGSLGGRTDLLSFASMMRSAGEAETESDEKKAQKEESPVRNAEQFKVPVLLVHGTHDSRSPIAQSEDMAKALERAGKPHKFVKIDRATQTFWRVSERATVLREVEQFLAANLQTGSE